MGSFKGPAHANLWREKLKLKGWLSSHLFQEHFPAHYAEILHSLPLPEYMDPVSGILNIAAALPEEIMKPDLGPCVYISYCSGENLVQADSVTKLRYDSYDMVSFLCFYCFGVKYYMQVCLKFRWNALLSTLIFSGQKISLVCAIRHHEHALSLS